MGDALQLHKAIEGEKNGGVGGGVSPKTALSVGLKVDSDALPDSLKQQLKEAQVDLDDPATTLALLKLNSVVGVTYQYGGPDQGNIISCSSDDMHRHYCTADTRGGVQLMKQRSDSPCRQGYSWGFDRRRVWVDHGCRADFHLSR